MQDVIKRHFNETIRLLNSVSVGIGKRKVDLFQGIDESCRRVKSVADKGGKVMFIGNGGSAAIASHMAIDYWKNGGVRATAFNDSSLLTCLGNDYGYQYIFEKPIKMFADTRDLLFAISSSGKSQNILNGVKAAKAKGCKVITLSGFNADNSLRSLGDISFFVPAKEYGLVEVLHQFICHYILDIILKRKEMMS